MARLRANDQQGTITDNPLTNTASAFNSAALSTFPTLTGYTVTAGTGLGHNVTLTIGAHPFAVGQAVVVAGVSGTGAFVNANGLFVVTAVTGTTIAYTTTGATGGAWTSGGVCGTDWYPITFNPSLNATYGTSFEIAWIIAHGAAATVATILRGNLLPGLETTTNLQFATGTTWEQGMTVLDLTPVTAKVWTANATIKKITDQGCEPPISQTTVMTGGAHTFTTQGTSAKLTVGLSCNYVGGYASAEIMVVVGAPGQVGPLLGPTGQPVTLGTFSPATIYRMGFVRELGTAFVSRSIILTGLVPGAVYTWEVYVPIVGSIFAYPVAGNPAGIVLRTGVSGLRDMGFMTCSAPGPATAFTITAASNPPAGQPIVVTTSVAHGYVTGQCTYITGVTGNTGANGTWQITVLSPTTFSLNGSTGTGAYVSGGTAQGGSQLIPIMLGGRGQGAYGGSSLPVGPGAAWQPYRDRMLPAVPGTQGLAGYNLAAAFTPDGRVVAPCDGNQAFHVVSPEGAAAGAGTPGVPAIVNTGWTLPSPISITNVSFVSTTITCTVAATAAMVTGDYAYITGITGFSTNNPPTGTYQITVVSPTTFSFVTTGGVPTGGGASAGTVDIYLVGTDLKCDNVYAYVCDYLTNIISRINLASGVITSSLSGGNGLGSFAVAMNPPPAISNVTNVTTTVTVTTTVPHGLTAPAGIAVSSGSVAGTTVTLVMASDPRAQFGVGQTVAIAGTSGWTTNTASVNANQLLTAVTSTSISFVVATNPPTGTCGAAGTCKPVVVIAGITGFTTFNPNGTFVVASAPSATTFTYTVANAPTGSYGSGGTVSVNGGGTQVWVGVSNATIVVINTYVFAVSTTITLTGTGGPGANGTPGAISSSTGITDIKFTPDGTFAFALVDTTTVGTLARIANASGYSQTGNVAPYGLDFLHPKQMTMIQSGHAIWITFNPANTSGGGSNAEGKISQVWASNVQGYVGQTYVDVDASTFGGSSALLAPVYGGGAITNVTDTTPMVVTAAAHGLVNGQGIIITGVVGNTAANGAWFIQRIDANTFALYDSASQPGQGNGVWTSGGTITLPGWENTYGMASTNDGQIYFTTNAGNSLIVYPGGTFTINYATDFGEDAFEVIVEAVAVA